MDVSAKNRRADGKAQTRRPAPRRTGKQRATKVAKVLAVLGEVFADIRPAATMVGVAALIEPSLAVEIEVDAVRG